MKILVFLVIFLISDLAETKPKSFPPKFADKLQRKEEVYADIGGNVRLICKIGGRPKPNTHWSKNGEVLFKTRESQRKYFVSKNYMVIKDMTAEDVGEYKCEGQNRLGSISRSFVVSIASYNRGSSSVGKLVMSDEMQGIVNEMKQELENLKKKVEDLPQNVVNIHMHKDNEDEHSSHHHHHHDYMNETRKAIKDSIHQNEPHIHMYMHVSNENDEHHHHKDQEIHADCHVVPNTNIKDGDNIVGHIHMSQKGDDPVHIHIHLGGFDMTKENAEHGHGFHIHKFGDMSDSCDSLGSHYNPLETVHSTKEADLRHLGDLGNIECDENGDVDNHMTDDRISLHGKHSVIGRSIAIHHGPDDLGLGGGNAGPLVACCVIAHADPEKHQHHKHTENKEHVHKESSSAEVKEPILIVDEMVNPSREKE